MASIEVLFDAESDAAVRDDWRRLSEAGLPSQHDHRGESNAPHITAAWTTAVPDLSAWPLPSGVLAFGGLLLFPRRRGVVLSRAVIVTTELLSWHAALHERLPDALDVDPHTRPGAWTPHVTLARSLPADSLAAAMAALDAGPIPAPATASAVRLWDPATRTVTLL